LFLIHTDIPDIVWILELRPYGFIFCRRQSTGSKKKKKTNLNTFQSPNPQTSHRKLGSSILNFKGSWREGINEITHLPRWLMLRCSRLNRVPNQGPERNFSSGPERVWDFQCTLQ
jgi:hypothetical protein